MNNPDLRSRRMLAGIWAGVAYTTLLTAGLSMDVQAAGRDRPTFEYLDSDDNGAISTEELVARLSGRPITPEMMLQRFDTDGSGSIEQQEFESARSNAKAGRSQRSAERFTSLDADNDGQLSKDEFISAASTRRRDPGQVFDSLDTDENGYLSAAEVADARHHRGPQVRQN